MNGQGKCVRLFAICMLFSTMMMAAGCSDAQLREKLFPRSAAEAVKTTPRYHEFEDVLIPGELEVVKKNSLTYRTPGFTTGVLYLKGAVEMNSLIAFFENNMYKDNWRMVSSFKSLRAIQRAFILFQKNNRWCFISITGKNFNTHVEIIVPPPVEEVIQEGLIK